MKTKVTAALAARFADRHTELQQAGQKAAELLAVAGHKAALDTARSEIDAAQASLINGLMKRNLTWRRVVVKVSS